MAEESNANAANIVQQIIKCVDFAAIKHKSQRRKDPEATPYINHPLGVANILSEEAGITDLAVIQGAILHDTIEDTETTLEEIKSLFGEEVAGIVLEVTDDKLLPKEQRKQFQIDNSSKLSHKAKLVRIADKIYNLRDLKRATPKGWSEERVKAYYQWSRRVAAGLSGTDPKLESILKDVFASLPES